MKITIGIDPGLHGAIAVVKDGKVITVRDMPIEAKETKGNRVDVRALVALCAGIRDDLLREPAVPYLCIEMVHAMRGQGVSTMFTMGDSFGCARMATALLGDCKVEMVHSSRWKKLLRIPPKAKKGYSLMRARRLYPDAAGLGLLALKKHEGRAEALLIAHYGEVIYTGRE